MPPDINFTGITAQQQAEIASSFVSVHGPIPVAGDPPTPIMTPGQWAKSRIFNYVKSVVQEARRKAIRTAQLDGIDSAVESEFGQIT